MAGIGGLECDISTGVREANDEDGSRAQLRWVAVLVRVQLRDRRVEVDAEVRDVRLPERPCGDDHLPRREALTVRGRHDEATVDRLDAIDALSAPDG